MSNNQVNPSNLIRSNGDEQKEQKVIVLSIKDMPSFKMKEFQESGQSIFNFKPQQLLQSSSTSIQVTQPKSTNIQVQPIANATTKLIATTDSTGAQYIFRTQRPSQSVKAIVKSPQVIPLVVAPNVVKINDDQPKLLTPQVSIQNKIPADLVSIKRQQIPAEIQLAAKKIVSPSTATTTKVIYNPERRTVQLIQGISTKTSITPALIPSLTPILAHKSSPPPLTNLIHQPPPLKESLRPILPKPTNEGQKKLIVTTESNQQVLITLPPQKVQEIEKKSFAYGSSTNMNPGPVFKFRVQEKSQEAAKKISENEIKMQKEEEEEDDEIMSDDENDAEEQEVEDFDDDEEEKDDSDMETALKDEKLPEKSINEDEYINVKRIIEGDEGLNNFVVSQNINNNNKNSADNGNQNQEKEKEVERVELKEQEEEEVVKKDKNDDGELKSENCEKEQQLSSDSLLCDEQIASVTPQESPENNDKSKDSLTPKQENSSIFNPKAMADVKRTLNLDLNTNENVLKIDLDEEDSVISDDTNVSALQKTAGDNDDDSLQEGRKSSKRSRKTKHPTVISNLGLPYKPPQAPSNNNNRRKKVDKKMELEHDFHDPLNKIQWEDGIGGLNNCNKLFGFDDFGLVEVINQHDAKAKLNRYEDKNIEVNSPFQFKKILNPVDQFVCAVCSKVGTIRDFFSPECCSQACLAITKRKGYEYGGNNGNDLQDLGQTSPTTEKKVMYGGEIVSLQTLQTHLLKQKLPDNKRPEKIIRPFSTSSEDRFSWSAYLSTKSVPAPLELFRNTLKPQSKNPFKVGMKLEAIDPQNQNSFSVCTVEERLGHRIKLHFDGFPQIYDFWVDAGSRNIFPIEFCRSTKRELRIPPKWHSRSFDWSEYLDDQNCVGAQRHMFAHLQGKKEESSPLEIGMKLEVRKDEFWYAGTIIDILFDRILIQFDGLYDKMKHAWFDFNSPHLAPCDAHKVFEDPATFLPPRGSFENFYWDEYLLSTKSKAVPAYFLNMQKIPPNKFEPGMKLEVVDKINPQLIRPATILSRDEYTIQVNFDGFDLSYAFWVPYDSEDIYPINYCKESGHPIEYPAGCSEHLETMLCSMAGCRGIGNGIFADRDFHENHNECPYNMKNWKKLMDNEFPSRFEWKQTSKRGRPLRNKKETKKALSAPKEEVEEEEVEEIPIQEVKEPGKRGRKRKIQQVVPEVKDEELPNGSIRNAKIKVIEHFLNDYGPQLNYSFDLWTQHSKVLDKAIVLDYNLTENPLHWSVDDVCIFITKFCDEETAAKFYAQKIDGEALLSCQQKDLIDLMAIKLGPAIKIYNRILHLRQEVMTKFLEF